ncbi:MAG: threonine synthase [Candidatus Methylomirabilis sp.]|nr:threonine synthase [Deltaproteobacteria bacterium]
MVVKAEATLKCIDCGTTYPPATRIYTCAACGGLMDVAYDFGGVDAEKLRRAWDERLASRDPLDRSGVWRFREMIPFLDDLRHVVTLSEGNTPIYTAPRSAEYTGVERLTLKHQGMNPTGSFKDNGMTAALSQAREMGVSVVACASTGNTSASMAAYAARAGMRAVIFIPNKQIAYGKLAQALDYGARTLQIDGDFDDAMRLVKEITEEHEVYLLNSINPFRLEGQKTIMIEMLQQRGWKAPDRVVVPGGNLGNSSSFGKAFKELHDLGFIDKMPMITIIQAAGSNPLYRTLSTSDASHLLSIRNPQTLATAIKIGNPVSWKKAVRALEWTNGWCDDVTEQEIADARAIIGLDGLGCEPASATTVAGIKKLVASGEIKRDEDVVAVLTGNLLKDPDYAVNYHFNTLYVNSVYRNELLEKSGKVDSTYANPPIRVKAEKTEILEAMGL